MNELEELRLENDSLREELEKIKKDKNNNQKKGMIQKASLGKVMSRAPFGYKIINNELVPEEETALLVEKIFLDFRDNEISLNQLSKKYNLSLNGLKKILRNFTYLGKIKFNGEIHEGNHKPLVSSIIFNNVQDKLDKRLSKSA